MQILYYYNAWNRYESVYKQENMIFMKKNEVKCLKFTVSKNAAAKEVAWAVQEETTIVDVKNYSMENKVQNDVLKKRNQ